MDQPTQGDTSEPPEKGVASFAKLAIGETKKAHKSVKQNGGEPSAAANFQLAAAGVWALLELADAVRSATDSNAANDQSA